MLFGGWSQPYKITDWLKDRSFFFLRLKKANVSMGFSLGGMIYASFFFIVSKISKTGEYHV